jgi:hypothetical protein
MALTLSPKTRQHLTDVSLAVHISTTNVTFPKACALSSVVSQIRVLIWPIRNVKRRQLDCLEAVVHVFIVSVCTFVQVLTYYTMWELYRNTNGALGTTRMTKFITQGGNSHSIKVHYSAEPK